jgi:glycosyltransferase involved in cell wall biosynthesis
MKPPVVSVVTPFYNTAEWLGECIESVLGQTYSDFEYLLVNNCSTDGSAEIARRYAASDPRIRLIDQPSFLSQSRNFNSALQSISSGSRYCKLILADDLLLPNCLAEMVRVADRNPSIGIVSSYYLAGRQVHGNGLPFPQEFFPGRAIGRMQLLEGRYFLGAPSVVMYRADVVRRNPVFYQDHRYSSDSSRGYQFLRETDFGFVHQVLSFLRVRDDSLGSGTENYKPYLLDVYLQLRTHGKDLLSPEEYTRVSRRVERAYFGFLGLATLYNRDPGLWEFTGDGLATIGESFSGGRRFRWALAGLAHALTHPGEVLRFLGRRISGGAPPRT